MKVVGFPVGSVVEYRLWLPSGKERWNLGEIVGIATDNDTGEVAHMRDADGTEWYALPGNLRAINLPDRADSEAVEQWLAT